MSYPYGSANHTSNKTREGVRIYSKHILSPLLGQPPPSLSYTWPCQYEFDYNSITYLVIDLGHNFSSMNLT